MALGSWQCGVRGAGRHRLPPPRPPSAFHAQLASYIRHPTEATTRATRARKQGLKDAGTQGAGPPATTPAAATGAILFIFTPISMLPSSPLLASLQRKRPRSSTKSTITASRPLSGGVGCVERASVDHHIAKTLPLETLQESQRSAALGWPPCDPLRSFRVELMRACRRLRRRHRRCH